MDISDMCHIFIITVVIRVVPWYTPGAICRFIRWFELWYNPATMIYHFYPQQNALIIGVRGFILLMPPRNAPVDHW
jgi:hypothetical protein